MSDKFNETTMYNTLWPYRPFETHISRTADGTNRSMTLFHQATVWRHYCITIYFLHPAWSLENTVLYTLYEIYVTYRAPRAVYRQTVHSCLWWLRYSVSVQGREAGRMEKPLTKQHSGTQTDTHFYESNIVSTYEWNEWELRRKAMKLVCISPQTVAMNPSVWCFHQSERGPTQ